MTKSIINKIQSRVSRTDSALKRFQETYAQTVLLLQRDAQQFGEAMRALAEVKNILDEIQGEMSAGVGHLVEGGELLEQIEHDHAHAATLILNLVEVYMQSDYGVLVQALAELDDKLLPGALMALGPEGRGRLAKVLGQLDDD